MTQRRIRKEVPATAHAFMDDYRPRAVIFSGGHQYFGTFSKLRYDKCDDFAMCRSILECSDQRSISRDVILSITPLVEPCHACGIDILKYSRWLLQITIWKVTKLESFQEPRLPFLTIGSTTVVFFQSRIFEGSCMPELTIAAARGESVPSQTAFDFREATAFHLRHPQENLMPRAVSSRAVLLCKNTSSHRRRGCERLAQKCTCQTYYKVAQIQRDPCLLT